MSRVFYDHLIILEEIEVGIKEIAADNDEREELWKLIDELIHHRVLMLILENLDRAHHEEFLNRFYSTPHDSNLVDFLNAKMEQDFESLVKEEMKLIENEIVNEIKGNSR